MIGRYVLVKKRKSGSRIFTQQCVSDLSWKINCEARMQNKRFKQGYSTLSYTNEISETMRNIKLVRLKLCSNEQTFN